MVRINLRDVPQEEKHSPHGKYRLVRQHVSLALGGKKDAGPSGGGHPFDLELTRLPAGATNFPHHQHTAQWELYLIIAGTGEVQTSAGTEPLEPGDVLLFPPEDPHQCATRA